MEEDPRITGMISEKDENSIIMHCNKAFLFYAGVKSYSAILGHTDEDFPWQEYTPIYREHELDALAGNNYSTIYPIKDYLGSNKLFLHTKVQKINPDGTKKIRCQAVEIIKPDTINLIRVLSKNSPSTQKCFTIGKQLSAHNLTERELEVLFLLLRGQTAKSMAKILDISCRTVETYIENIKVKFNCHYKNEIIEHAINNGYMGMIPKNLPTKFVKLW